MKPTRTTGYFLTALLLPALLVLVIAASAPAQTPINDMSVEGTVEAGGRWFLTDEPKNKDRAKFEEYRDMGAGGFLQGLELKFFTPDLGYGTELSGKNWGREDQQFSFDTGRIGLWRLDFDWDQMRHVFSTNARTAEHEIHPGVWVLPPISSLSDFNGQATSRELHDVSVRWDTARMGFTLTPTPDLDLSLQYTRIHKDGYRPFGMSFGSPGGNFLELLEPIQQTVHDVRVGGSLVREKWQVQFGYTLSIFQNDLAAVSFENPCFQAPIGGSAAFGCPAGDSRTAALNPVPRFGQSSLPPNNVAHTFNLSGGVNLPMRTRITGAVTYSLALQNADFLPHTINPSIAANPDLALPQPSLNGNVQTVNLNLGVTSRPLPLPLTLSAKYRLYDLHDVSDSMIFPGHIVSDRPGAGLAVAGPEQDTRHSFARHNADVDARYQIMQPLAVTVGGGWERWNRGPDRNVKESDEVFGKLAVDATPVEWLLARLTYKPSFRRDSDYSRWQVGPTQLFDFRMIDQSERDRQRVDLLLQITPLDTLWVTPTASYRYDDFIHSAFGVQWETAWSAGIDFGWSPIDRLTFSAGYMHELTDRDLKSNTCAPFNCLNLSSMVNEAWISSMTDTVDTFYVNGKVTLIPKVLEWNTNANYSASSGTIETRLFNGNQVGGAPFAVPGNALPKRMPAFDDQLIMLTTALRYHLSPSWTVSAFYTFEQWLKQDWRTDGWLPWNPILATTTGSVWLGNDQRNYEAHMMGLTLAYTFK